MKCCLRDYGNNLKAFAAELSTIEMVGIDRIHELLADVFDISVSTDSVQKWITQLSSATKDTVQQIRERVSHLSVQTRDETGLRVNGSLHWLHCLCVSVKCCKNTRHGTRGDTELFKNAVIPTVLRDAG